jgi:hypothetical protein
MFLLIDKGARSKLLPYARQFMLFEDFELCLAEAIGRGFTDAWGMFANRAPKPGMMNTYSAGEVDISIMQVRVQ